MRGGVAGVCCVLARGPHSPPSGWGRRGRTLIWWGTVSPTDGPVDQLEPSLTLRPPGLQAKVQETTEFAWCLPRPCDCLFLLGKKHESGRPGVAQSCRSAWERRALAPRLGRSLPLGRSQAAETSRISSESCLDRLPYPSSHIGPLYLRGSLPPWKKAGMRGSLHSRGWRRAQGGCPATGNVY